MPVLVRDVMIKNPITLDVNATIGDAVGIFGRRKVGCLPVVDEDGRMTAILSDGDIIDYVVRNVRRRNNELNYIRSWYQIDCFSQYLGKVVDDKAMACATRHVITVNSHDTVREAASILQKKHLKHIPVLEDGKLVGIISRTALIQGMFMDYVNFPDAECIEEGQDDDF